MSKQLRLRRGTTAEHSTFIGAEGEVTVDTTKDTLVVHDGVTIGGHPVAREDALQPLVEPLLSKNNPQYTGTLTGGTGVVDIGSGQIYKDETGRVGIGTATPVARFDVAGSQASNVVAVPALNIDCSQGNYFTKTINSSSTFTVSNVPQGRAYSFILELTHTSGTVTWFANLQWPNGTPPSLTTGRTHLFVFVTDDGGLRWRGVAQPNYTT